MVRLILSTAVLFSLMSCGRSTSLDIQTNIQSSIEANAESVTHTDWESSEYNPGFLFENIRQELSSSNADDANDIKNEMCTALKNLSDDSLLIFENEIINTDNADVLINCKVKLTNRLNNKNALNRIDLKYSRDALSEEPSNIDFKLNTKVISNSDYINFNKYNASVGNKEVILTFDDGPHNYFTASVLKTLKEAGDAKAMFFELGKHIKKYPETTQKVSEAGHVVANHSWSHLCMNDTETCRKNNKGVLLTDEQVTTEISDTFSLIQQTIGKIAPFFRFPYGDNRKVTSEYLKKSGVLEMSWNSDSNDWRYNQKVGSQQIPFTSKDVLASALRSIDRNNSGVVLFHDIHRRSVEILPQFLYELYKRNYTLVILDPTKVDTKITPAEVNSAEKSM